MRSRLFGLILLLAGAAATFSPGVCAGSYVDHQIAVILHPGHAIGEVNDRWGTTTLAELPQERTYLLYVPGNGDLEQLAEQMSGDEAIASAQANYIQQTPEAIRQMVIAAVGGTWEEFEDQELTERIGLDEAHLYGRGAGITVAVLDTGVDPAHELFAGRLSPDGYDFLDMDDQPWETANGIDDDEDGLTDEGVGHGSMVAGIVALVAPEATLLPIRILDDEGRTDAFRIALGIHHAILHGAEVINMSFGVPLDVDIIDHMLGFVNTLGIAVVAGAGNENREEPPYYPAALAEVFMVTAVDSADVKAVFADYHTRVLVSAPGVGVRSAYPGNDWGLGSGCSFATPMVSGECALLLGLAPGLAWEEIEARLGQGVDAIDTVAGNEPYAGKLGSGRIYLPRALEGLASSVSEGVDPGAQDGLAWPNPAAGPIALRCPSDLGDGKVEVTILEASGRVVGRLPFDGDGPLLWDGTDRSGRPVPAGIYFVRFEGRERTRTVRLAIAR